MKSRIVLAFLLCLASIQIAHAESAGRVLVAVGEISAERGGRQVVLETGSSVEIGDVIKLGDLSNAQIRFSDQAIVSLRPRTVFRIDDYRFSGQEETTSAAVFSLLRGGLRTITGLIGKTQRGNYRVRTPVATVGIRGTHYNLVVCQQDCFAADGSLAADGNYGGVLEGRVAIANLAGEREFGADEYFYVADANTIPQTLRGRPGFLHDRLEARRRREEQREALARASAGADDTRQSRAAVAQVVASAVRINTAALNTLNAGLAKATATVAVTELRDAYGNVAILGTGLGAAVAAASDTFERALADGGKDTIIVIDGARGTLEKFSLKSGEIAGSRGTASVIEGGQTIGDGAVVWGRWTPDAVVQVAGQTSSPLTGVHFIYGNLTPISVFARPVAMIGVGASSYDYVGGTRPTDGRGNVGQFVDGVLGVDFLARTISGTISYKVGGISYGLPIADGTPITSRSGEFGFSITARNAGIWTVTGTSQTGAIDTYSVSGLFLGSRAQGLGITFATNDQRIGISAGAAAFRCRGCKGG